MDRYPEVLHQENITKILVSFRGERQETRIQALYRLVQAFTDECFFLST